MSDLTNIKSKIFNDPLHGFITIPRGIIYEIIDHPYLQRLRRINQLGLTNLVYSGGNHTRFQHTLGAFHLMTQAINVIRQKGHEITDKEEEAVCLAILLHDIGHGPFSHTLENSIIEGVNHESISIAFMHRLSSDFNGALDMAIDIFTNRYTKKFLHQLVSSQIDMDRLDYLMRDSFFTGVSEGIVGSDRLIQMLNVADGNIVIEAKGIYSVEKFILARRLMYWQVYLHKTVISAENLLIQIMKRAAEIARKGKSIYASPALSYFLRNKVTKSDFMNKPSVLSTFAQLDDFDIIGAIKVWMNHDDIILAELSKRLINRRLLKVEISETCFHENIVKQKLEELAHEMGISTEEANYFILQGKVENRAYKPKSEFINILHKNGEVHHLSQDAAIVNINVLSEPEVKYYLCHPA